jgi:N-acetylglucosaminyl-diphospho-decaprenol L-rhamnosyltransferase
VPHDPVRSYGDDVAVAVVSRPGVPLSALLRTIRSVPAAGDRPVRVVVAASGTDPVDTGADVVRLSEDVGRGAAVNRAVAELPESIGWVALADPGVVWQPGSLDALLAAARPRAGALGPRLLDASGAALGAGGDLPGLGDVLRGRDGTPPRDGVVGWLPATCLVLRRAALDSVDGFDPRYPGPLDDLDLAERLGRAGWLVLHVPDVTVTAPAPVGSIPLEPIGVARRRYVHDRSPAPARVLRTLAAGRRS